MILLYTASQLSFHRVQKLDGEKVLATPTSLSPPLRQVGEGKKKERRKK